MKQIQIILDHTCYTIEEEVTWVVSVTTWSNGGALVEYMVVENARGRVLGGAGGGVAWRSRALEVKQREEAW